MCVCVCACVRACVRVYIVFICIRTYIQIYMCVGHVEFILWVVRDHKTVVTVLEHITCIFFRILPKMCSLYFVSLAPLILRYHILTRTACGTTRTPNTHLL